MLNSFRGVLAIIDVHGDTGHASHVPGVVVEGLPAGRAPVHAIVGPNNAELDDVVSLFLNGSVNLGPHDFPVVRMYSVHQRLVVDWAVWSHSQQRFAGV